jgi:hypothetical protein
MVTHGGVSPTRKANVRPTSSMQLLTDKQGTSAMVERSVHSNLII